MHVYVISVEPLTADHSRVFSPQRNVPLAILAQYIASFSTGFLFLIALFYAVPDLEAVTARESVFPLSLLYLQATSAPAAAGLLSLCLLTTAFGASGGFVVAGRQGWALAREGATPYATFFTQLHSQTKAPFRAIFFVAFSSTGLGCLYLESVHAFNALAGSFVVFTSLAYLAAIIPHLISGRKRVIPGPFWMPWPIGHLVNGLSCLYLVAFGVIFCFPNTLPVTAENMNYTIVIVTGWTLLATVWWYVKNPRMSKTIA